ncbi:MAG: ankyrin repeat domain-containing protein [Oscillospiraceae bacterium]|nr:ankyrin repeat domain-containing protein [Oscillospiraceae bacterium]
MKQKLDKDTIIFKIKMGLALGVTVGFVMLGIMSSVQKAKNKHEEQHLLQNIETAIATMQNEKLMNIATQQKEKLNDTGVFSKLPIYTAIENDNMDAVLILVGCGAKVNIADETYSTPLSYSAKLGKTNIYDLLIKLGADKEMADNKGKTPIFYATLNGLDMLKKMMNDGAVIYKTANDGTNLLHMASLSGNIKTYEYLLNSGIDECEYTTDGKSVLHFASESGEPEMFKMLISRGFDALEKTKNGENMLHLAGSNEMVGYLLGNFKLDVNEVTIDMNTPFHIQASFINERNIKALLSFGANINATDTKGKSPIFYATPENILAFVENGADVNLKDYFGKTVYDYAKENKAFSKEILGKLKG